MELLSPSTPSSLERRQYNAVILLSYSVLFFGKLHKQPDYPFIYTAGAYGYGKDQEKLALIDANKYYPRIDKTLPSSINGVKPSGSTWTQNEFKAAFKAGKWNTLTYTFTSNVKIRPMLYFTSGNPVDASTGSSVVYLDNIGFSYIEE